MNCPTRCTLLATIIFCMSPALEDPWGNKLRYKYPGHGSDDSFDLFSLGPDGKESEDDIGNWDTRKGC